MNKAKLLRSSIRFVTTITSVGQIGLDSPVLTQVTQFSKLTRFQLFSPVKNSQNTCNTSFNLNQKVFFSTNSQSFTHLILHNDWSEKIEIELEKLDPKLTHEAIVYVLMKLNSDPQKSLDFFKWVCVRKGFDPSYVPYSVLLRVLACKEFIKDFWVIALEMQEKGFYFENQLYVNVYKKLKREKLDKIVVEWSNFYKKLCDGYASDEIVKYVVDLILECDWSDEVISKLRKKVEFPLSENFVYRVLRELSKEQLKALKFFEWIGSCGGYEHDSVTYNAMLKSLAWPASVNEFWELAEQMKSKGFEVDFDTFVKALRHLPIGDCVKLFEMLMDGTHKPSLPECSALLWRISAEVNPDMDLTYRVFNKCVAAGDRLSKRVYDIMHRILCKIGRFDEAKKIMQEMEDAGYEPDNITYSQEIFGLCSQKRFEEACNLLEQMELNGCVPDVQTWTILIQGYCTADQVDDALICFGKMREKNVDPDAHTLEVLIYGFLSKKKVFGAYRFLVEMVNKGRLKPWQFTYKLMIEKLAEVGKVEEALELLELMKNQDYPPYPDPIVKVISKSGTIDDAKKVLLALTGKDGPSNAAYVKVIKSFFEEGREKEAKEMYFSIPYRVRNQKEIRNLLGSCSGQATYPKPKTVVR